jgi:hypothetical protein
MLTDEQEFHLENIQCVSQDKKKIFQALLSQTHFLNKWRFL